MSKKEREALERWEFVPSVVSPVSAVAALRGLDGRATAGHLGGQLFAGLGASPPSAATPFVAALHSYNSA